MRRDLVAGAAALAVLTAAVAVARVVSRPEDCGPFTVVGTATTYPRDQTAHSELRGADLDLDGRGVPGRTRRVGRGDLEEDPDFAPDGRRLVVASGRGGVGAESATPQELSRLYVVDAATGDERRLLEDSGYDAAPSWSPDGSAVVFTRRRPERQRSDTALTRRELWIASADGSESRRLLAATREDDQPAFSPDGRWVAFARLRGEGVPAPRVDDLWVVGSDGSGPRRLQRGSRSITAVDWSPDGRRIAYADAGVVKVLDVSNGTVREVASGSRAPQWLPDSRHIAYATTVPSTEGARRDEVVVADVDGTTRRPTGFRPGPSFALSPCRDGEPVAPPASVPLPPAPPPPLTGPPATLEVVAGDRSVAYGQLPRVRGALRDARGRGVPDVLVDAYVEPGSQVAATATTDEQGRWEVTFAAPRSTRVRLTAGPLRAGPVPVSVRNKVVLFQPAAGARTRSPVLVRGHVEQRYGGIDVRLQRRTPDGWVDVAATRTNHLGQWQFRRAFAAGPLTLRVLTPARDGLEAGDATVTVLVG